MKDFLTTVVAAKRRAVTAAAALRPLEELRERARARRDFRSLASALAAPGVRVIAEIKRASPSLGPIRPDLDPAALARAYASGGAAAISVLTERDFFMGCDEDLIAARAAVALPVLRKDFVIEAYQLYEAAALGADGVLLIVRMLGDAALARLHALALELGLDPLVEVYDGDDATRALGLRPRLVGINNRDLRHFVTDADNAARLAGRFGDEAMVVAASGVRTQADVVRARAAGLRRFLIGETLVRARDPAATLTELIGAER